MVKHKPKRKFGKYLRGIVDEELGLGTLAAKTLVSVIFDNVVFDRTKISSIDCAWALSEWTVGTGIGPFQVGVAHSDYTDAEIEEYIEATGSWNEGNLQAQEAAKRRVRTVGIFPSGAAGASGAQVLGDGKMIKTKLNWILLEGQSLRVWAYNTGVQPLATTAPEVQISGIANLWPQ